MKKLGFYGCGNMGKAILGNIIESETIEGKDILINSRSLEKRKLFASRYGVAVTGKPSDLSDCAVVILGFKPQNLAEIEYRDFTGIVVSILAGIPMSTLRMVFPKAKIIRVMPNLPIRYGKGVTGIYWKKTVLSDYERDFVRQLFEIGGKVLITEEESFLHEITGLFGSSPAYFLYFSELLVQACIRRGIKPQKAESLVQNIFCGTAEMLKTEGLTFSEFRKKISSPNGVTQVAVNTFEDIGFDLMEKIVDSAINRSKEMGGKK